jgi:hypothetical protein
MRVRPRRSRKSSYAVIRSHADVYPNSWRILALDELGKITLAAHRDHRTVITDANAGMFAAAPRDA